MLQKLGYSSKLPTAVWHGPEELGGLALMDFQTELGISTLIYMRNAIYSGSETGKIMILSIKYSQIEAGIKDPTILENTSVHLSYLTPTKITFIRQFQYLHNMTVSVVEDKRLLSRDRNSTADRQSRNLGSNGSARESRMEFLETLSQSVQQTSPAELVISWATDNEIVTEVEGEWTKVKGKDSNRKCGRPNERPRSMSGRICTFGEM